MPQEIDHSSSVADVHAFLQMAIGDAIGEKWNAIGLSIEKRNLDGRTILSMPRDVFPSIFEQLEPEKAKALFYAIRPTHFGPLGLFQSSEKRKVTSF